MNGEISGREQLAEEQAKQGQSRSRKKKARAGQKSYVTKIFGKARATLDAYDPSQEVRLRQYRVTLEERSATLQSLDDDILELIEDPDSIAAEVEESGHYRQDVHKILIRIENLFTSKVGMPATSENTRGGSTQQIVHIPPENASRLPKLTLPHFSGDPVDWIHFWDSFSAAVDKKTSLSDIKKFTYLRSVLEGEAATAIAALSLTATNYRNAVELLTQRFGKDTVIINSYMNRLMKISPLKSGARN